MGRKIVEKVLTMIGTAFGVVVALAWDDAVRTAFRTYFPRPDEGVMPRFVYAFMLTCLFMIGTTLFAHFASKK